MRPDSNEFYSSDAQPPHNASFPEYKAFSERGLTKLREMEWNIKPLARTVSKEGGAETSQGATKKEASFACKGNYIT